MVLAVIIGTLEGTNNLPLSSTPICLTFFAVAASMSFSVRIAAVACLLWQSLSPSWLQIPYIADYNLDLPLSPQSLRLAHSAMCLCLVVQCWTLNLGLCAWWATTLPTLFHPQPKDHINWYIQILWVLVVFLELFWDCTVLDLHFRTTVWKLNCHSGCKTWHLFTCVAVVRRLLGTATNWSTWELCCWSPWECATHPDLFLFSPQFIRCSPAGVF